LKRWPVFPVPARQLVTLAFVLILLPLLVLAWQAWQSLNALSAQARISTARRLSTPDAAAMINAALEMERSYRQYCVLDDPTLEKVYQNQRKRYSEMLDAHAGVLPDEKLYQALRQDLNDLRSCSVKTGRMPMPPRALKRLPAPTARWCRRPARWYSRGQQLQQEIAERGQFFGWQALVLFC
jgi:two-component system sensor histidine kinase GlrK